MGMSISVLVSPWNEILGHRIFSFVDILLARSMSSGSRDAMPEAFSFEMEEKSETRKVKTHVPLKGLIVNTEDDCKSANELQPEYSLSSTDRQLSTSPRRTSALDDAATKLQKVFKSYRTRRNLADCAVVVEELWWKALDFAALDHSSVSFFSSNRHETAATRWCRARTRAAKVGKGLSLDEKAQKLALHHWLEAIDPRHRYGRNLHIYFDVWSDMKSYQPFFYWLDIGDGKEVNLPNCPRIDLHGQCIQYLGPKERASYEVIIEEGKLKYKQSGILLNTVGDSKWIFVLSTSRSLYVGKKKKGAFQHSSFLSGGVTTAAGRLLACDGTLEAIWPYSGHYLPTEDNFKEFISFLEDYRVDMTNVKRCSIHDEEEAKPRAEDAVAGISDDVEFKVSASHSQNQEAQMHHKHGVSINTANIDTPKLVIPRSLSRTWTTGAGPRIGCVRDYPLELQSQALEKVSLSPSPSSLPRYSKGDSPIPTPRPSPNIRLSPRLSNMRILSPMVSDH